MKWYEIIIITFLIPIGFYLREITYKRRRKNHKNKRQ